MITKTLLTTCRCHLRVHGAGRSLQRSTTFRRSPCCESSHLSFISPRCFSQIPENRRKETLSDVSYCSEMAPHIRSCLNQRDEKATELSTRDTGFTVAILGSGASTPSTTRNTSATVLRLGGMSFLFDAGEGIQLQMAFSKLGIGQIQKIFISHLHGDHLFGLPGLLLQLRTVFASKHAPKVDIYGPPGLHTYICANLALACSAFAGFNVVVHELVGGAAEGGPKGGKWGGNKRQKNIFLDSYPEISNRWLTKRRIERNADGTWTIEKPPDLSAPRDGESFVESNNVNASSRRRLYISAAEVTHLPGVQTFGFVVKELEPPRKIDPEKATLLGVKPGPKYKLLKHGFPVMSDDNSQKIQPESVLLDATTKARKFALIGDNCGVSPAMASLCQNADVLVHEATVSGANVSEIVARGHSSAEMAGAFAKSVNAKVLLLNHLSASISSTEEVELIEQVKSTNDGVSRIVASQDFMEVIVPRLGFGFDAKSNN